MCVGPFCVKGGTRNCGKRLVEMILDLHTSLLLCFPPMKVNSNEVTGLPRSLARSSVQVSTMLEAICAIHLASYVTGPVTDRGGLMLVGPPGNLKTTLLDVLDENYHNAIACSNLNSQTLQRIQGQFSNGSMRSLILPDLQACYAGDPRTAARLEQALMQLAGEGHRGASWQDSRFQKFKSRCTIFAAMTNRFYERYANYWEDTGFQRRFLWSYYTLGNPDLLLDALEEWRRADIGGIRIPELPANHSIPNLLSRDERHEIRRWLKYQPGPHEIQYHLLCCATSALRWHYEQRRLKRNAIDTMREFAATLHKEAALLTLRG